MPVAWRIVRAEHAATAFSGEGAAKTSGRWNSRGVAAVYTSATKALAALETLVHLNPPILLRYKVFRVEFAESVIERIKPNALPINWMTHPPPDASKTIGDAWVKEARSAVLAVPSVIIPEENNYLLNPAHRDFKKIRIGKAMDFAFDARIAQLVQSVRRPPTRSRKAERHARKTGRRNSHAPKRKRRKP